MARIHRTVASQFARDLVNIQQSIVEEGVENVGKRTPSDPTETGCRGKNPLDCRESVIILYENYSAVKTKDCDRPARTPLVSCDSDAF